MSYHYSSYSRTTTKTTSGGISHTTTTTRTSTGDSSSVIVRELTESELSHLSLPSTSNYEITDDDRLTKYDFYSLMDSEDEDETESESESDIEAHWFPSLLRNSFAIQFLDDKEQADYIDDDTYEKKVQVIENEEDTEDTSTEDDDMNIHRGGKRNHRRHTNKHIKRPRKTEQVPVEVIYIRF